MARSLANDKLGKTGGREGGREGGMEEGREDGGRDILENCNLENKLRFLRDVSRKAILGSH